MKCNSSANSETQVGSSPVRDGQIPSLRICLRIWDLYHAVLTRPDSNYNKGNVPHWRLTD